MAKPWTTLDSIATNEGQLELRRRGERDFLITLGGLVLMNSTANRSEMALGQRGCQHLRDRALARVLVGGLGMGCTLRAVLDTLPADATVVVAELNPVVVAWCRGPLAGLTDGAVNDPRVRVEVADVAKLVASAPPATFDAIIFDLYRGPHFRTDAQHDPLYGSRAIARARGALKPGGVFAIWGETPDERFVERLRAGGFAVTVERPGRGGLRHAIFLAERPPGSA
jgi:spermidine synthase